MAEEQSEKLSKVWVCYIDGDGRQQKKAVWLETTSIRNPQEYSNVLAAGELDTLLKGNLVAIVPGHINPGDLYFISNG